ncbi:hypothetical protein GCM10023077_16970 [Mycolicibacterium helvum]
MTPSVELQLRPDRLDISRLRCQERGESTLVMDRVSGRWVALNQDWAKLLPLIDRWHEPGELREPIRNLRTTLIEHEVGVVGSERHFDSLNTLILKLTAHCNHACTYCYDFETAGGSAIEVDVATDAIRQGLALCDSSLQVILHGGEPMLVWARVEEIVQAGEELAADEKKRLRFVGQTNMSRLSDRIRDFSWQHDIVWGVSVDGPAEIHDRLRIYRNGSGTYRDFAQSLARFPDFVKSCGVLSTITVANQDQLTDVCRHFRDLGMASWEWSLFQPIGRGRQAAEELAPDPAVLVAAWNELFDAVLHGEFEGFPVRPIVKYTDNFLHGPGTNMCMRPECGAGRDLLSISADGTIEACDCIDTRGPLAGLGKMGTDSLDDARKSSTANSIRGRDLCSTRCAECVWWGVCGGGCLARAPHLNAIPDLECALALNAFDRIADQLVVPGGPLRRYLSTISTDAS